MKIHKAVGFKKKLLTRNALISNWPNQTDPRVFVETLNYHYTCGMF